MAAITHDGSTPINKYKVAAFTLQAASYITTLWFVEWVWSDGQSLYRLAAALVVEFVLFAMKSMLFDSDGKNDAFGWAGFVLDTITNMGGFLIRAGNVITFPLFAVFFKVFGVYDALNTPLAKLDGGTVTAGGMLLALIAAILLSVGPHKLWNND